MTAGLQLTIIAIISESVEFFFFMNSLKTSRKPRRHLQVACFFFLPNGPKPKDIKFLIIGKTEKQQILHLTDAGTREYLTFLLDTLLIIYPNS